MSKEILTDGVCSACAEKGPRTVTLSSGDTMRSLTTTVRAEATGARQRCPRCGSWVECLLTVPVIAYETGPQVESPTP